MTCTHAIVIADCDGTRWANYGGQPKHLAEVDGEPEQDAIRLDTLAAQLGVVPTDISIDVEGAEWHVLRGAERLIAEHHPRLWVSIHPTFMAYLDPPEDATDMFRWITNRGYRPTFLEWHHELCFLFTAVGGE